MRQSLCGFTACPSQQKQQGCELTSVAALHMVYRCSGPSAMCPWIILVPTKKMQRSAGVQAAAGG